MKTSDEVQGPSTSEARSATRPTSMLARWWQAASRKQRVAVVAALGLLMLGVALWAEARTS